jgi:hypothetical protein
MTAVGTTSYYSSETRYTGYSKSNSTKSDDGYSGIPGDRATGGKAADAASTASIESNTSVDARPSVATFKFMGRVITATSLAVDLKPMNVSELPEDQYQAFIEGEELALAANKKYLENQYTDRSWTDTVEASLKVVPISPASQAYASIVVGGKVMATIDNQGVVTSDDALGETIRNLLQDSPDGAAGPELAQARAEQIAELLGGSVQKSDTALTQGEFNALPAIELPEPTVDYEAMKNDPQYAQLQKRYEDLENLKQQREAFLAQPQIVVED